VLILIAFGVSALSSKEPAPQPHKVTQHPAHPAPVPSRVIAVEESDARPSSMPAAAAARTANTSMDPAPAAPAKKPAKKKAAKGTSDDLFDAAFKP